MSFATAATCAAEIDGHWEGEIDIPNQSLAVKVDLLRDGDDWRGSIDIPAQGAARLPLDPIEVTTDGDGVSVVFTIRGVPGNPTFKGRHADDMLVGEFSQGGVTFGFRLARVEVAGPARPQTPKPPFPYAAEEVAIDAGPAKLGGTLTVPNGNPPFPAVLLISGSGPQDRDETLFDHKPFWVLADHLSRSGIAVLRVDDAGTGASTPHPHPPTTADFANDAAACVDLLLADPRFSRVGLVGHSEGGLIAAMVAGERDDIDFVVLLAGPGVSGAEVMRKQNQRIFAAAGLTDDRTIALLALLDQLFEALVSDFPDDDLRLRVEDIALQQLAVNGIVGIDIEDDRVQAAVEAAMSPWMRYFLRLDPRPSLERIKVPILALNGDLDLQVDADQNLGAIAAALAASGHTQATIRRLPGLNHLFQHAQTGLVEEYASIEETMAPEVLDLIRDWILDVAL
ncbi:MAG: alpha/beta fold hydrolase [Gammaproteobacteria bacterium]|nr:alpha/beta fold hydrolase [Gammaproteobacteria bacterium]